MRLSTSTAMAVLPRWAGKLRARSFGAFGQVPFGGSGHGDWQRSGLVHGLEQGGRGELVPDGAPLPAALGPKWRRRAAGRVLLQKFGRPRPVVV